MAKSGDIQNHAAFIWSVADLLRGDYKHSEYGGVILPLVVLRRPRRSANDGKRALAQAAKAHTQVQAATARFHGAVVAAAAQGCSTRAIAERVELGHQRIHGYCRPMGGQTNE